MSSLLFCTSTEKNGTRRKGPYKSRTLSQIKKQTMTDIASTHTAAISSPASQKIIAAQHVATTPQGPSRKFFVQFVISLNVFIQEV